MNLKDIESWLDRNIRFSLNNNIKSNVYKIVIIIVIAYIVAHLIGIFKIHINYSI